MSVRHDVAVHPASITAYSQGQADVPRRRRSPARKLATNQARASAPEALMAAVKAAQRPGERIVVVSATEVHLVPDRRPQA